nr:hypothetical protein [Tanacetum cinerariifolium]
MHNNIMAAGLKDRPPMLATGRYAQWRSWFLRYIDTRTNGDALRKRILEGIYTLFTIVVPAVPATKNSLAVLEHTTVETLQTMSPKNKAHYESEKEAIHLILNGIGDEIYSTIDACKTAKEIREAIERADNKRKTNDTSRNNHGHQQQPFKKQNVDKVNNMGMGERKPYEGSLPKCTKCQRHHNGPCTQKCHKCNKVGHFARDCRSSGNANVTNAQRDGKDTPKGNGCF